ncbi:hypothetical protein ACQKWADRAFT_311299 [Trichoderma austrokoningii]
MERPPASSWSFFHSQKLFSLLESSFFSLLESPISSLAASSYAIKMVNPDTGVYGAIGAVLGYVGAEAATVQILERLLWPQRSNANVTLKSIPVMAFLMPMGGPLHIIALKVLDIIWTKDGQKIKTESVRDCFWVRALSYVPIPKLGCDTQTDQTLGNTADQVRAKVAVSHLTFTKATKQDAKSKMPFVKADVGRATSQVYLAILAGESSAILAAIGIAAYFKSLWALWWLIPLLLRLVSALFALDRKPLDSLEPASPDEEICDYEIHCPESEGSFMLLTGPKSIVEQFFVHYGHPVRNRFREAVQLAIVILFGLLFLLGLFFSVIWMPIAIQKVWVCYHFCSSFAMIVMRYTSSGTSTEAMIAKHFGKQEPNSDNEKAETAILFGHTRDGSETAKVSFVSTYHNHFLEGQACMDKLLRRKS